MPPPPARCPDMALRAVRILVLPPPPPPAYLNILGGPFSIPTFTAVGPNKS